MKIGKGEAQGKSKYNVMTTLISRIHSIKNQTKEIITFFKKIYSNSIKNISQHEFLVNLYQHLSGKKILLVKALLIKSEKE